MSNMELRNYVKNTMSKEVKNKNNVPLPIFKLNLDETEKGDGNCRRKTFGKHITKENKIIMMVGATGAGKTTLINGMINYILGVQWKDDFRFVLTDEEKQKCQTQSQTPGITAYQINFMDGFKVPYTLTIVDTPGFGDSRGISHDQKITKYMHEFFSQPGGIDHIDAVCFVVQAPLARLTPTQKYIFDCILSIFGKDIAKNILVLVTFADANRPPVLDAVKVSGVPCSIDQSGDPLHFKFNNSALFVTNKECAESEDDGLNLNEMYWKIGFSNMKKLFNYLNNMETKSLSLTRKVLDERKHLEVLIEGIQPQIKAGLTKLDEIKKTRAALGQNKALMEANKDFEYEVEVNVPKQVENTSNNFLTNCQNCHFTCHDSCIFADDKDKFMCWAMKDGKCTVCPGKCVWNVHFNQKYKFVYVTEKKKATYQELKKRFEAAHGGIMSNEKILGKLAIELIEVSGIVYHLIEQSKTCLERLQEIALKPNPLSTPDYIDLLIKAEIQEVKPGFQDRIQSLNEVKEKANIISNIKQSSYNPLSLASLFNSLQI